MLFPLSTVGFRIRRLGGNVWCLCYDRRLDRRPKCDHCNDTGVSVKGDDAQVGREEYKVEGCDCSRVAPNGIDENDNRVGSRCRSRGASNPQKKMWRKEAAGYGAGHLDPGSGIATEVMMHHYQYVLIADDRLMGGRVWKLVFITQVSNSAPFSFYQYAQPTH